MFRCARAFPSRAIIARLDRTSAWAALVVHGCAYAPRGCGPRRELGHAIELGFFNFQ